MSAHHPSTEIYRRAFQYAEGLHTDVKLFVGAMFVIMRDRVWEAGWVDQVSGKTVSAPSLKAFIERPVPKGIGQSIEWTYAALRTGQDLGDKDAAKAIKLLDDQLEKETGKTAKATYKQKSGEANPTANEHGEVGRGRPNRHDNVMSNQGNSAAYALGRLKRDHPALAEKVVAGELSANAAAIEAGFRKKLTTFEQVMKLIPKLTAAERKKVKAAL